MAYKFVPYAPEGSGGKDPVLAELTVTENGVYDEPMIGGGPEPITWDGVAGDRVTVKSGEEIMYTKLSDKILSVEDLLGGTIVTNQEREYILDSTTVFELGDVILGTELVVVAPKANATLPLGSETITFPEAGIYFFGVAPAFYVTSFAFPASEPIPADGWNKVTVDVQPDPVLAELVVTENGVYDQPVIVGDKTITWDGVVGDKTCVYTDEAKTSAYVKVSDDVLSFNDFVGAVMTNGVTQFVITEDFLMDTPGVGVNCAALILSVRDADAFDAGFGLTFTEEGTYFNISFASGTYIESFTFSAVAPADGWNKVTVNVAGDIVDVSELPTEGIEEGKIYRVTNGDTVTYAIPNANPVKRLVDGVWTDLT